ncbi:MAG: hypothetical protein GF364_03470 [Candidatus Lokiarchaeota archaeon]|nr:hypothetical protein [Candidatus Lokiarchaeota archaeon]
MINMKMIKHGRKKDNRKLSKLAIAAEGFLVISFLLLLIIYGSSNNKFLEYTGVSALILSFVLSIISLIEISIRKNIKGYSVALVPIFVFLVLILFQFIIVRPGMKRREEFVKNYTGKHNLQIIYDSILEYSKHNNELPLAISWCDSLMEYSDNISENNFKHPFIKGYECNYAYNDNISNLKLKEVSKETVLVFGSDGRWNQHGGKELLKQRPQYETCVLLKNGDIYIYNFEREGIEKWEMKEKKTTFEQLRWKP